MSRVPDWLLHHPIAHRGLHDVAHAIAENSLPAFWAATRAGYPVELDVRLLADGEVVVFHDRELDRLTSATGPIAARRSQDIARTRPASQGLRPARGAGRAMGRAAASR